MGAYTGDGGVVPAGLNIKERRHHEDHKLFGVYQGNIEKVIYADDTEESKSEVRTEYVINVNGQDYQGAIKMCDIGGIYNHQERILDQTTINIKGEELEKARDEDVNGEIVWVMFINGNADFPLIIGSAQHPENRIKNKPVKEDGQFEVREFNGIEFKIDKDSNYTVHHRGRKDDKGELLNKKAVESKITFFGNGDYLLMISDGRTEPEGDPDPEKEVSLMFTKETKKLEIKVQKNFYTMDEKGISTIDLNENNHIMTEEGQAMKSIKDFIVDTAEKLDIKTGDDSKIDSGGKLDIKTAGDSTFDSGGKLDVTIAGDGSITATGKMDINAIGKLIAAGIGGTDLGSPAAPTNVFGATVLLAGGGAPIARIGDISVGIGNLGAPVVSTILSGSPKVLSG